MVAHPDVLILGGGVIGLTVAYHLAREGVRVEVVDKGDFGQESSWAGAGIVPAPGDADRAPDPYGRMLSASSAMFPAVSQELRERTGIDNGYVRCGGLWLTHGDVEDVVRALRAQGIRAEPARPTEPALGPNLGPVCHLPDMAQVRNPRHVKALVTACASLGVALRPGCPVYVLECRGGRVAAAVTGAGRLTAGQFLVTTGAWADGLLEPLGCRLGVRPVRGQIVLLRAGTPPFRMIVEDGKRYLVPRPDGRVLVGSTEEDVGFDKNTTAAAVETLLHFATNLVPALKTAALERCWAGLRPGSPDGLPFLGPVAGADNLFVAAGHYRAGIQLSPATGRIMTELLLGRTLSFPLDAFRPDRAASRV